LAACKKNDVAVAEIPIADAACIKRRREIRFSTNIRYRS
jgi:hypothetical protein